MLPAPLRPCSLLLVLDLALSVVVICVVVSCSTDMLSFAGVWTCVHSFDPFWRVGLCLWPVCCVSLCFGAGLC